MYSVVFDMDNTITSLSSYICKVLDIKEEDNNEYDVRKNKIIPEYKKIKFIEMFNTAEVFMQTPFVEGSNDIFKLEELNIDVKIKTLSYSKEIIEVKKIILEEKYGVEIINKTIFELGYNKSAYSNYDFVVEDCTENLITSEARIANILIDKYNNKENRELCKNLLVVSTLKEAIDYIKEYVKENVEYAS